MKTPTPTSHARRRLARGMTLLEVVMATLMLGMVAVGVASTMSYTLGQQGYNELRLGAYEVANRLVIQYLDDDTVIARTAGRPIEYGTRRYAWDYSVAKVEMKVRAVDPSAGRAGPRNLSRYELVTVKVWLERPDGAPGSTESMDGEPLATLTRLLDPVTPRNPDAMNRLAQDPNRMMDMIGRVGITSGGEAAPSGSTGNNGRRRNSGSGGSNK